MFMSEIFLKWKSFRNVNLDVVFKSLKIKCYINWKKFYPFIIMRVENNLFLWCEYKEFMFFLMINILHFTNGENLSLAKYHNWSHSIFFISNFLCFLIPPSSSIFFIISWSDFPKKFLCRSIVYPFYNLIIFLFFVKWICFFNMRIFEKIFYFSVWAKKSKIFQSSYKHISRER